MQYVCRSGYEPMTGDSMTVRTTVHDAHLSQVSASLDDKAADAVNAVSWDSIRYAAIDADAPGRMVDFDDYMGVHA